MAINVQPFRSSFLVLHRQIDPFIRDVGRFAVSDVGRPRGTSVRQQRDARRYKVTNDVVHLSRPLKHDHVTRSVEHDHLGAGNRLQQRQLDKLIIIINKTLFKPRQIRYCCPDHGYIKIKDIF